MTVYIELFAHCDGTFSTKYLMKNTKKKKQITMRGGFCERIQTNDRERARERER